MSPKIRTPTQDQKTLQIALEVFAEKGFERTTMLDIASRAKVSKGTLYALAPSKEDLFLRIVTEASQQMVSEMSRVLVGEGSPTDRLVAVVEGFLDHIESQIPFFWLSAELLAMAHRNERLRREVYTNFRALYAQFFGAVTSLIESGQRDGTLGPCHPESVARILGASMDGLVMQCLFEGEHLPRREIAQTLSGMLRSLLRDTPPNEREET